jgi:malate synthase
MRHQVVDNSELGTMGMAPLNLDVDCDVATHLQASALIHSAYVKKEAKEERLKLKGEFVDGQEKVLTEGALSLLTSLCDHFATEVAELLNERGVRKSKLDAGELPDFLPQTRAIREDDWKIRGIPDDLSDRRVEITGSVDRKTIINALNSNAKVFMADFEDSASSWKKRVEGQLNLRDAVNGELERICAETGKLYQLNENPAVLFCRVRGLHMVEKRLEFDGIAIPAALFDFALYFYNNYRQLLAKDSGPYFYIPKLESHLEARWWAKVFAFVEEKFCLQQGTIKCTCLIETLPAVFEMDEIVFELRSNIVALNCGRWDDISNYIKALRINGDPIFSNKQDATMDTVLMSTYSRLLVKTCHKRGALAIGGMAAFIPVMTDELTQVVLDSVHINKELEARNGHDGTWIAHHGLADTAMGIFNQYIGADDVNQLHITCDVDGPIEARALLTG